VLEAMLRLGLPASFSCQAGSCHVCMMRAIEGSVPELAQHGIPPELASLGYFLPCQCKTIEPLVIDQPNPTHLSRGALVAEKLVIRPDLAVIRLEVSPEFRPIPGQHIAVVHPDGERRPYSIASRPEHDYFFELHVRRIDGGKVSRWLVDEVSPGDTVRIQPPAGGFINRDSPDGQKLLLIATGTGLAPLLPILQEALERNSTAGIWLFHGGRHRRDLYADDRLRRLAVQDDRFHYFGCCSRQAPGDPLLSGRVTEWIEHFLPGLSGFKVFVAGHPEMVADVSTLCSTLGVDPAVGLITDAFEFDHARVNDTWEKSTIRMNRSAPTPDPELWGQLGNGAILQEVLRDFYELAFEDERLGPFFAGVTQQRLREKQYSFLRSLMLGTRDYLGQRPRNAHHWMVISDDLFDYRLERMTECMRAHGISEPLIRRWHAFEEFFRADIVKHQPIARTLNGQPLRLDGFEDMTLDEGSLCDACNQGIDAGSPVRVNLRLGTVYCHPCFNREPGPGSDRPEAE